MKTEFYMSPIVLFLALVLATRVQSDSRMVQEMMQDLDSIPFSNNDHDDVDVKKPSDKKMIMQWNEFGM